MSGEQKIRAFLFYLCVLVFLIGLPFILSFALGFKFDMRAFKFTKTGLISIKTQPSGANVYFGSKALNEKTPTSINELLPGEYSLRLELEKYYPWASRVIVEAGKVTQLDKIILFPLRPDITQLNKEKISSFWVDIKRGEVYYIDLEGLMIYKSDLEGGNFQEVGGFPELIPAPKKWRVSADKQLLVFFNPHQLAVVSLEPQNKMLSLELPFVVNFSNRKIQEVFWHSDNYHLILITDKSVEVLEARPQAEAVNLVTLNKRNTFAVYDTEKDILYFIDSQRAEDGKFYDNVYKLELSARLYPFMGLIKTKQDNNEE